MIWLLLAACTRGGPDTGPTLETGWFTDTGDPPECEDRVTSTDPEDGAEDWYWLDWPTLQAATDQEAAYSAVLLDAEGAELVSNPQWEPEERQLRLDPSGPLTPETAYGIRYQDCAGLHAIAFTTSAYGLPLEDGPKQLEDHTYDIRLDRATWTEPEGFGSVLQLYFTTPVLIGVEWADDRLVDLLGAPGWEDDLGAVQQDPTQPSWDFPAASFEDAPAFHANAPEVNITFDGVDVPIHRFELSGTFSADGATIGGGRVRGLGDTRNMGGLIGDAGNENAICEVASGLGAECTACPDGEPYCLQLDARHVTGRLVEGLVLVRRSR